MTHRIIGCLGCLLASVLVGQGCQPMMPISPSDTSIEPTVNGNSESGKATYEPFTQDLYNNYFGSGTPTILFFYANWCPTCTAEQPVFERLIHETDVRLHALRVNYNDSDTDEDEAALAKQYGIFIQHTFVYLDGAGNEVTRTIGTQGAAGLRKQINALQ